MLTLNVLYFAHVRERVGLSKELISLPEGARVGDAVALLVERHPDLAALIPSLRVALDGAFVVPEAALTDGGELVLIPPVSGGAGAGPAPAAVALTEEPLDGERLLALQALVSASGIGGIALFVGQVRDHARGRSVTRLEYEAYPSMALEQMKAIVEAVEGEYPGTVCALHHRVGTLEIGDVAVIAAAGSAHRAEAFGATRELIERLKRDVPIWKREIGPDGAAWVSDRP